MINTWYIYIWVLICSCIKEKCVKNFEGRLKKHKKVKINKHKEEHKMGWKDLMKNVTDKATSVVGIVVVIAIVITVVKKHYK